MANYRYSVPEFRRSVLVALAITAMVAGLVWMLVSAAARPDAWLWSSLAALVFFALVSAGMLWRFIRNEVVLAVRPTGLFDARTGVPTIPWEEIRDLILLRREDRFELEIYLWHAPSRRGGDAMADYTIGLGELDAAPERIVRDIASHKPVTAGPGITGDVFTGGPG